MYVIWQASFKANKLRQEVDEKESEIKRLQMELHRRQNEGTDDTDGLRRVISNLEKENIELKVGHLYLFLSYSTYIVYGHLYLLFA